MGVCSFIFTCQNIQLHFLTIGQSANLLDFGEQWKVLIYDHDGRDIISPLLNVGALRQKGVTLHMMVCFLFDLTNGFVN